MNVPTKPDSQKWRPACVAKGEGGGRGKGWESEISTFKLFHTG